MTPKQEAFLRRQQRQFKKELIQGIEEPVTNGATMAARLHAFTMLCLPERSAPEGYRQTLLTITELFREGRAEELRRAVEQLSGKRKPIIHE